MNQPHSNLGENNPRGVSHGFAYIKTYYLTPTCIVTNPPSKLITILAVFINGLPKIKESSTLGVVWFAGRGFDGIGSGSGGVCRSGSGGGSGVLMCLWCSVSVYGSGVFF